MEEEVYPEINTHTPFPSRLPRSLNEFSLSGPSDTPPVGMSRELMTWSLHSLSSSSRSMWVRSSSTVLNMLSLSCPPSACVFSQVDHWCPCLAKKRQVAPLLYPELPGQLRKPRVYLLRQSKSYFLTRIATRTLFCSATSRYVGGLIDYFRILQTCLRSSAHV